MCSSDLLSRSSMGIHVVRSRPQSRIGQEEWYLDGAIMPWGARRPQSSSSVQGGGITGGGNTFGISTVYPTLDRPRVHDKRPTSAKRREILAKSKAVHEERGDRMVAGATATAAQRNSKNNYSRCTAGNRVDSEFDPPAKDSERERQTLGSAGRRPRPRRPPSPVHSRVLASPFVRINLSISARLVTVNMSFEVNSCLLKATSRGWHEIEIADELLTCVRTTLERDAMSILEISSMRDADIEWKFQEQAEPEAEERKERILAGQRLRQPLGPQQQRQRQQSLAPSAEHWIPLVSAKAMKDAVHNSFRVLMANPTLTEGVGAGVGAGLGGGGDGDGMPGLNVYLRVIPKRRSLSAGDGTTQQKNAPVINNKPVTLGVVDAGSGLQDRAPPRPSSRLSLSRGLMGTSRK